MEIGDFIGNLSFPPTAESATGPKEFVGKALVVFFYSSSGDEACRTRICGFRDLHREFHKLGVEILGISREPAAAQAHFAKAHNVPYPLLSDSNAQTCRQYGVLRLDVDPDSLMSVAPTTFLIRPDFRLAKVYSEIHPSDHPGQVLEDARNLITCEPARRIICQAPVLLIPDALPPELCKTLIGLWETDNGDSGFMREVDGKVVGMYDRAHKIRRDHFMKAGELQSLVQSYITRRVTPEVQRIFNYSVTRREDYRIACYDASRGGYFRPHRDNTTEGTAHRRFAMSLLLNDDYEGGFLRFPEFGRHTYRPEVGGAVIFSCSLLHEATDVTAGRRFVLLSFFYGEAEAKAREQYNLRTGGSYKA